MKINVTEQDIQLGEKCKGQGCPIALALRREIGRYVEVGPHSAVLFEDGIPLHLIRLPREAVDFILDFDCGDKVEPFSFYIDYYTHD